MHQLHYLGLVFLGVVGTTKHFHKLEKDGSLLGNGVGGCYGALQIGVEEVVCGDVSLQEGPQQ